MDDLRRGFQRRRHCTLQLSKHRFLQRSPVGGGPRTVLINERSLARVLHHRSSQRRTIHCLPRYSGAAYEPRFAGGMDIAHAKRGDGSDYTGLYCPRIHPCRSCDHDARRTGQTSRPQCSSPPIIPTARRSLPTPIFWPCL